MRHPRYPAYKDSSVDWLGKIPAHWEPLRLRFACDLNPSKSEISHLPPDTKVSFLPMERIGEDGTLSLSETRTLEQVWQGYTYFRDGDVAVAKITPCFENGKGALLKGLANGIGFGTTELHILRAREGVDPRFVFYLTHSHFFRQIGEAMMYGAAGQQRVPEDLLQNFVAGFPPLSEQCAIAAFLDRQTAEIDVLIAEQRHLIELLQERRTALVSHAVTKGLDPGVPMKDSGIPWLCDIPEHWGVVPLKHLTPQITVGIVVTPSKYYVNEGIPCLRSLNVKEGFLTQDDLVFISLESNDLLRKSMIFAGDLVSVRSGQPGTTAVVDEWFDGANCIDLIITRQSERFDSYLVAYFMNSFAAKYQFGLGSGGAIQQHFNIEAAKNLLVLVPPFDEQHQIAAHLDRETAKIDALIAEIETGIAHLEEYRTALISAAVTGKIDVRDALPADAPAQPHSTEPQGARHARQRHRSQL